MLKIWGRTNSVNVQKALWCLAELDVPYERVEEQKLAESAGA
jgi:glutathione S-transferase